MFTEQQIVELFEKQWPNIVKKDIDAMMSSDGGISAFEAALLHLYILDTRPSHIVEFSPNKGYSTFAMASAQKIMRNRWALATFDISTKFCNATEDRIEKAGLQDYCTVFCGDAIKEVPKYIKQKVAKVELCFIDSDHGEEFANKYIDKIFPYLADNCLIAVHDIAGTKRNKNGQSKFRTSLQKGNFKSGEEIALEKYLKKTNTEYSILHSVTGGQHEGADLPANTKLYDRLLEITSYDFQKAKSEACPKMLFFRLKK